MNNGTVTEKDLDTDIQKLFDDFLSQLLELKKPEKSFTAQKSETSFVDPNMDTWKVLNIWHLHGSIQVFDTHLSVLLRRLWEDNTGWRGFDPRPGVEKNIELKLNFASEKFSIREYNTIAMSLEQKIKAVPGISYTAS